MFCLTASMDVAEKTKKFDFELTDRQIDTHLHTQSHSHRHVLFHSDPHMIQQMYIFVCVCVCVCVCVWTRVMIHTSLVVLGL